MTDASPPYTIQGRPVSLPCEVRDAASGAATYLVDAAAARRWLPDPSLDVTELLPGRALLSIACIDYRENDLGDYAEISLALFVRERRAPRGLPYLGTLVDLARSRIATYIHRLPVTQSFTCEAGRAIWGFPKTVDEIRWDFGETRARCAWRKDGHQVLTMTLPRGGTRTLPDTTMQTYTMRDGALHVTPFVSGATGFGVRLGGASLALGDHPIADELRALRLPKRPLMTTWMEHMHGRFEAPRKL
ncbi:MAG TPA: acetoacetate decarboxylase family protein [Myxococcota bacterium]|jgi:hypothetical protein|nr:acetoacetate decarboxylase family protein [Myxococcota bacterium]